ACESSKGAKAGGLLYPDVKDYRRILDVIVMQYESQVLWGKVPILVLKSTAS
ncbi:hypothetical protein scyTo_0010924, partial [Scyliorhinus torazame]|nr:hypothetical protein [Scyliorhinus torazame]